MFNIQLVRRITLMTVFLTGLVMQLSISTANAENGSVLDYEIFVSPEREFMANSVIIYGAKDAVLIDTTFTLSSAEKLAQKIKKLDRKLTAIYLTHGHPDHAFATSRILKYFPEVRVYASSGVIGELERDFYSKLVRWQLEFPNDLAPELPAIYPLKGKLELEGHEIQWLDTVGGETWDATVFYVPSIKTLIAGDLIFNKMHLFNTDVYQPKKWIDILNSLRPEFGDIKTVIPGHGEIGDASLIALNREYQEEFISVATLPFPDLNKVYAHMVKEFPDWKWPIILHMTRGPAVTYPELLQRFKPEHAEKNNNE